MGAVFVLWSAAYYMHSVSVSPQLGVAVVLCGAAWVFYQESRRHETFADLLLAISFLSWGAILIGELLLSARAADSLRALEIRPSVIRRGFDGHGTVRRGKAPRRTQHARAFQRKPGHLRFRRPGNSANAFACA